MNKHISFSVLSVLAFAVVESTSSNAHALFEECGNIQVDANADCELQVEGGCDIACEPPQLTVACSGELYAQCDAECDVDVNVDCAVDCSGSCEAECEVDPGSFDCEGYCNAECEGDCDAQCSAADNQAECKASCNVTCGGECGASCEASPPSADCSAKCEASCEGRCEAEANIDCQVDCQAEGYVDCKADLKGSCEAQCSRPEGALICDGQFVDADDVGACVGALEAALDLEVEVSGDAEADCVGNECSASAEGSVGCSFSPSSGNSGYGWALSGLALGLAAMRRRRQR